MSNDGQRSITGKDLKLKGGTLVQDVPSSEPSRLQSLRIWMMR
jgi:hypothetical protein